MLPDAHIVALSVGLAALVGFAAAYGGICAVRAVRDLLEGRGGTLFLGFLKCSPMAKWVSVEKAQPPFTAAPIPNRKPPAATGQSGR